MSLTTKQRRFVEEYTGPANFNATEAAKRAGYSEKTAHSTGWENLRKPEIAKAVEERLDELSMSAAEVTKRLTEWGRGSLAPFQRITAGGDVVIDLSTKEAQDNLHLIREIQVEDGRTKIKLHDAKDAAVQIGKIHGLYVDRVQHEGSVEVRTLRLPAMDSDPNEWASKHRGAAPSTNGTSGNGT